VTHPLGLEPEQENERACRADVDGHGLAVEAALRGITATASLRSEATIGSPFQEVADSVAALRFRLVQPAIEIVLAQLLERHSLLVDPGEQLKGDQDPAMQVTPC
jgi:hypothetical protein